MRALVVHPESASRALLRSALESIAAEVTEAESELSPAAITCGVVDLIAAPLVAAAHVASRHPAALRIVIAGAGEVSAAVAALDEGAFEALRSPLVPEECKQAAARAQEHLRMAGELRVADVELASERERLQGEAAAQSAEEAAAPANTRRSAELSSAIAAELHACLVPLASLLAGADARIADEGARAAVRDAEHAARQATQMADDLIDVDRSERARLPIDVGAVALTALVAGVVESTGRCAADYESAVDVDFEGNTGGCETDGSLLTRALHNLIESALRRSRRGRVRLRVTGGAAAVRFSVIDSGSPAVKAPGATLFDRRARLDGGTLQRGASLALVRAVAEALGGAVSAETTDGGGLSLSIEVPRETVRPRVPRAGERRASP